MDERVGLGNRAQSEWPEVQELVPFTKHHDDLVAYLRDRLRMSERAMSNFYPRWRMNERRLQAYLDLVDNDKVLKEQNQDKGRPTKVVSIQLPYAWATLSTICTYLLHTFVGRRPMFQVGANSAESVKPAQNMEIVLQYNADKARLAHALYQFFWDAGTYGVGVMMTGWTVEWARRTVWRTRTQDGLLSAATGGIRAKTREDRKVFEGNTVANIDPFMFFPDPRVPMHKVNRKGEFVFWRSFVGLHELRRREAEAEVKWIDSIPPMPTESEYAHENRSDRGLRALGTAQPGQRENSYQMVRDFVKLDQGSVWIIPREHGLSEVETPELWTFTIANDKVIIQAAPSDDDHGMHPVVVTEPLSVGYGFGQLGTMDFLADIQDTLSWFINSHIMNVRSALNNMFIYDPSMIEEQDIKKPGPEKLIRLKQAAYGADVRTVIQQLQVMDVTANHVKDMEVIGRIGDALSGVNDNLRGLHDAGGRKTATEVRTSGEAGASRLAALARIISSQAIVDLTEQMCLNIQQRQNDDFFIQVVGQDQAVKGLTIAPEQVVGDFHFPVHDGTLPLDKVAMLDIWKEILFGVAADPVLRSQYSLGKIFEYVAELGGAKNISSFKIEVGSPEHMMETAMAGMGQQAPTV